MLFNSEKKVWKVNHFLWFSEFTGWQTNRGKLEECWLCYVSEEFWRIGSLCLWREPWLRFVTQWLNNLNKYIYILFSLCGFLWLICLRWVTCIECFTGFVCIEGLVCFAGFRRMIYFGLILKTKQTEIGRDESTTHHTITISIIPLARLLIKFSLARISWENSLKPFLHLPIPRRVLILFTVCNTSWQ